MSPQCQFLIDNNLPYYCQLWNNEAYVHQYDLGDDWKDGEVWDFAKSHNLTIITKDSDFSNRILLKAPTTQGYPY